MKSELRNIPKEGSTYQEVRAAERDQAIESTVDIMDDLHSKDPERINNAIANLNTSDGSQIVEYHKGNNSITIHTHRFVGKDFSGKKDQFYDDSRDYDLNNPSVSIPVINTALQKVNNNKFDIVSTELVKRYKKRKGVVEKSTKEEGTPADKHNLND